jgi:hypothetical protein
MCLLMWFHCAAQDPFSAMLMPPQNPKSFYVLHTWPVFGLDGRMVMVLLAWHRC